jgi:Wax ester synthase/diacylglycerol acyltransferase catalytic domain/WS/DGAT C-terminal domain
MKWGVGVVMLGLEDEPPGRPLSAEDAAILESESPTVAGHTCKLIVLDGPIDVDGLRAMVQARLPRAPDLGLRLGEVDGALWWVPAKRIDLEQHVVAHDLAGPCDQAGLRTEVARLFVKRLDRSRPPWRIDVIPHLAGGGSALIWRIHHALADGSSCVRLARQALWDEDRSDLPPGSGVRAVPRPISLQAHQRLSWLRAVAREAPQPWLRSPFEGHIGGRREVAFAAVELDTLRLVARRSFGATVNDAVLAVVAGGLRRWLETQHGHLGELRVKVPVSLHGNAVGPESEAGNRDSFFCLDLPLESGDPLDRLAAIHRATRIRKEGHDAQQLDALMHQLERVPPLREFANRVLTHPRSFALNVSNVPGPPRPVRVLGVPVVRLYSVAEIRERHAMRVAVVSLAQSLNFGIAVDPTLISNVDELAVGIRDEARALCDRLTVV